jgi:multicomponent Na+:H+ antiporter subunit D
MFGLLPPAFIYLLGALVLPLLPKAIRPWAFLVPPVLVLLHLSGLEAGTTLTWSFATFELTLLRVDTLAHVFGWIFALVTVVAGIYALHNRNTGEQVSALLYSGAALGAIYAGDLFTLVFFWEIMAFASAYLVWARGTKTASAAAWRYLFVHLFGGSLLMAGVFLHVGATGSLAFEAFAPGLASWLILLGFGVNAAMVPFHAWIADAYPRGTVTGSVFLSAFTTKTAVYTLARGFEGWEFLVWAGLLMALYGVTYAILSNDIRRVLAYHIVSQVGFMVTGIGIGTEMAINGATSHAYTHILYKGLLFMATGAVLHATGKSRMSELGGLYSRMPWAFWAYMVAALSISSAPFFSGFISKPMTISAAEYASTETVVLLLHLASVGTFLSVGLKLPFFTWFGKAPARRLEVRPLPWNMYAAMGIGVFLNILLGVWPAPLYGILPYEVAFDPYELKNLKKGFQLLAFTALVFFLIAWRLKPKAKVQLDTDWFYRAPRELAWRGIVAPVVGVFAWGEKASWDAAAWVTRWGRDPVGSLQILMGRPVSAGRMAPGETASTTLRVTMTLMMVVLLAGVLFLLAALSLGRITGGG